MPNIIQVAPNKNGRVIIQLYGKDYDVTSAVDEDGRGSLKAFSETYHFELHPNKTATKKAPVTQKAKTEAKDEA